MERVPCLVFGEILLDCFADGSEVPGGAPFNVAWHLRAFGLDPCLISRVGRDAAGHELLAIMAGHGMTTAFVQQDDERPTGRVAIHPAADGHTFEILADQAYDHIALPAHPLPQGSAFLYHGSLALRQPDSRSTLEWLKANLDCPVFLDVNLRAPWWERSQVLALLAGSTWAKLNEEELALLVPQQYDTATRALALMAQGGKMQCLIVTRGADGALLFTPKGHPLLYAASTLGQPVVDSVGAGDAFCAVLLLGLSQGWSIGATMHRAQDFAAALLGHRGATVDNPIFYQSFLTRWET